MTKYKSILVGKEDLNVIEQNMYIRNNYSDVMKIRSYHINVEGNNVILTDILFIPSMERNLVPIFALTRKAFDVCFAIRNVIVGKNELCLKENMSKNICSN